MVIVYILLIILALALCLVLFTKMSLIIRLTKPPEGDFKSELTLYVTGQSIDLSKLIDDSRRDAPGEGKKDKKDKEKNKNKTKTKKAKPTVGERLQRLRLNIERGRYTYLLSKRYVRRKIRVETLDFDLTFGLDDAAHTGIAVGAAWGSVYNLFGFVDGLCTVKSHKFNITPVFDGECLELLFYTKIKFSLSNIIAIAFAVFTNYLKAKRKIK